MSEQELRDGLQLAVTDEPPMKFNLDDLVVTAERLARRRRALVAVGAGTAMVAVAAVTVPVVLGIGHGSPAELPVAAAPTSAPLTVPPPSAPTSFTPKPKPKTQAELTTRGREMQNYLKIQLPKVVKGAVNIVPQAFGGEAEGQISEGQEYLEAFVKYEAAGLPSAIDVQVSMDTDGMAKACENCEVVPQTDGTRVLVDTFSQGDMKILSVTHMRADGTATRVATYNYNPTAGAKPTLNNVMLDTVQLTALATDPQLHI